MKKIIYLLIILTIFTTVILVFFNNQSDTPKFPDATVADIFEKLNQKGIKNKKMYDTEILFNLNPSFKEETHMLSVKDIYIFQTNKRK